MDLLPSVSTLYKQLSLHSPSSQHSYITTWCNQDAVYIFMPVQNCLLLSQVAYCYLISSLEQNFFPLVLILASFFHSLKFSLHLFLSIFVNFHGLSIQFSVSNCIRSSIRFLFSLEDVPARDFQLPTSVWMVFSSLLHSWHPGIYI